MNKFILAALLFSTTLLFAFIGIDIYATSSEIEHNDKVIFSLMENQQSSRDQIREMEVKIRSLQSNPRVMEQMITEDFKMIRDDQFIVNDNTN